MDVNLIRLTSSDEGTFSILLCEEVGLSIQLIELPDRNNETGMSRIPSGSYRVIPYNSPKFGRCYLVTNVPGRSAILIHKGNLAGDTRKGWKTHSRGCLLPGTYKGRIGKQLALLNSTKAFTELRSKIGNEKFTLNIINLC